jgi:cytochrome c oxidase subunit II
MNTMLLSLAAAAPGPTSFDLPPAVTENAYEVDGIYNFIYWFSVFFTVLITGLMLYWVQKHKRKKGDKRIDTPHYPKLEIAWTVIPAFFVIFLFHIGWKAYIKTAIAGQDAMEVRVRGQKWFWTFKYPNGREENNNLTVPVGKQVKFVISASDVLHSFYIPGARIKRDAVPGMYTTIAFTPTELGDTPVYCAEYCGAPLGNPEPAFEGAPRGGHSGMMAMIHVVTQEEFDKMMKEGPKKPDGLTDAQWGEKLYKENACITCHTTNGDKGTGPTWKGMWGHPVALNAALSGGKGEETVDENYVRESILKPNAKVVNGFNPVMPPYTLSDKQIEAIMEFMKTLQ